VAVLEAIVNSIRVANTDALPEIVREIRSGREDLEYYAPLSNLPPRSLREDSPCDTSCAPLEELGKIMGSLQLDEGQVILPKFMIKIRCAISARLPIYRLSQVKVHTQRNLNFIILIHPTLNYPISFIIPS